MKPLNHFCYLRRLMLPKTAYHLTNVSEMPTTSEIGDNH